MYTLCRFHANRVIPATYHQAFALIKDGAGLDALCKDSLDARLDNADDDPELEPLGLL